MRKVLRRFGRAAKPQKTAAGKGLTSRVQGSVLAGVLVLPLSSFLLAGCGSVVKQTFDLNPVATGALLLGNKAPSRNAQILVGNPGALKALDSQNIVIRGADGSVAYLKKAQWSDRLTDMVQMRLIQGLEDSRRFGGVGRPRDGINANYQLITDLRIFGVDADAAGKFANIEISAKIMDNKIGTIRKTRIFTAKRRVSGRTNADYAVALDAAFAEVLQDIVRWMAQSV